MNNFLLKNVCFLDGRFDSIQGPEDIYIYNRRIYFNKKKGINYKIIDCKNYILIPSFVQLHVHLCQHLYKGLAEDMSLFEWLEYNILPYENSLNKHSIYLSSKLALYEMIDSGTTAFLDMGTFKYQEYIFKAIEESGMEGFSGNVLMDRKIGKYSNSLEEYIDYTIQMIKEFNNKNNVHYVLCPRFLPGVSEKGIKTINRLASEYDLIIHTHASETKEEIAFSNKYFSMGNIEVMDKFNILSNKCVIAHVIHINQNEMNIIKNNKVNVVHCPSANMKLGSGIARINQMNKFGINVCLGSDGAPCNNNNNQLMEMRMAGLLQKVQFGSDVLNAKTIFNMATVNGYKALGLKNRGFIQENYFADLILLKKNNIYQSSFEYNPFNSLIYSSYSSDIDWVFCKGRALKENGRVNIFCKEELLELRNEFLKNLSNNSF